MASSDDPDVPEGVPIDQKLESLLLGHPQLSTLEIEALVSNPKFQDILEPLVTLSTGSNVEVTAFKLLWVHFKSKWNNPSKSIEAFWISEWKRHALKHSNLSPAVALSFLSTLTVVIHSEETLKLASDNPKSLAQAVSTLLQSLSSHPVHRNAHKIRRLLAIPSFSLALSDLIQPSTIGEYSAMINVLTYHAVQSSKSDSASPTFLTTVKSKLLDIYGEHIISSKTTPSPSAIEAFSTLLSSTLNSADLLATVFPPMEKMIRRSPDCLPTIASGLKHICGKQSAIQDVSQGAGKIMAAATEYIVSSSEIARNHSQSIIASLSSRVLDASGLAPLIEKLTVMLGKQLNNVYERQGLFKTIALLAQSCPSAIGVSDILLPLISKAIEKEKNKDVIAASVQALASFVAISPSKLFAVPSVTTTFTKGLADTNKDIVLIYLTELWRSFSKTKENGIQVADSLYKPLVSFVVASKTKPALASESFISFAILTQLISLGSEQTRTNVEKDKLWELIISAPESFLMASNPDIIARCEELNKSLNTTIFTEILITLLKDTWIQFANLRIQPRIWATIFRLLLHTDTHWRRPTLAAFASLHQLSSELSSQLHNSVLTSLEAELEQCSKIHEDDRPTTDILVSLLRLASTPHMDIDKDLPRMLLLSQHPMLQGSSKNRHLLKMVTQLVFASSADANASTTPTQRLFDSIVKNSESLSNYLFSESGINSRNPFTSKAAHASIAYLMTTPIGESLVDKLCNLLSYETTESWLSFTTAQVGTFNTPEGQVYQTIVVDDIPEVKDNRKKDDDEKEIQKKIAAAKRKHQELVQAKWEKLAAEALVVESGVRAKVRRIFQSLNTGLSILHIIAREYPQICLQRDALLLNLTMDSIASLSRHYTQLTTLATTVLQWIVFHCFNHKYLTKESQLSAAIAKPTDSDAQSQVIEDFDANAKHTIDAASWYIFQPVAISAVHPFKYIKGHAFSTSGQNEKEKGNTESPQHLPRHVLDMAFSALDRNSKYVNPTFTQCLLALLESSPSFSSQARNSLVESASSFDHANSAHLKSLEILGFALDNENGDVRLAVLDTLVSIPHLSSFGHYNLISTRLWKTRFDTNLDASDLAVSLYRAYSAEHPLPEKYWDHYSPLLPNTSSVVRLLAAKALVGAMNLHPTTRVDTLNKILQLHKSHYVVPQEQPPNARTARLNQDASSKEGADWYLYRLGVADSISQIGELAELPTDECQMIFTFLINSALVESDELIYNAFVDAGIQLINLQGASNIAPLIKIFEGQLNGPVPSTPIQHRVREAVVVFLGTVVQHLPSDDPRVDSVIQRLLTVLETPSEPVQRSVALCLTQIVKRMENRADALIKICLQMIMAPGKGGYALQRGGAWALAGIIKGLKPISLQRKPDIVTSIKTGFGNRQDPNARIGSSLAVECLSATLGVGFEPWILYFLTDLVAGIGDGSNDVREVTLDAARVVMSQLSGNGVRLVLPSIMKSLDDNTGKWKAKVGAIELIGAMGHCQPQQLGQCLPQIVPRLSGLLADPHSQVQKVAKQSLEEICSNIHNPEIKKIVPQLLKAIDDPKIHSPAALDALAHTDFVNRIDNASLSLIMPVLDRALRERASDTKKRATKIVGIMCNLTEPKALIPYEKALCDELKVVLADPQPITRAMAAHALGQFVKGLGTASEIVPYLLDTMKNADVGMIERVGAAQGLAHVASHMEIKAFRTELLPKILSVCESPVPAARQGYLSVFQFLPETLGPRFEPLMDLILPVVLKGLSDEQDMVREAALAGGSAIVKSFGDDKVDVLIPVLRDGLFDKNWRIRLSSIQLLGDLLYQVSGAAEDFAKKDLTKMMEGTRAAVLASLYLLRLDNVIGVAQLAASVWKMLVPNTAKTLKQLMPTMMTIVLQLLSVGEEERDVASGTLAELVNKMGDRVLGDIIPILEKELDTAQSNTRVGICYGIAAVLESIPKHHINDYFDLLLPTTTKALCDADSEVRSAAAIAFDALYRGVGDRAIHGCLPLLLTKMEDPDPEVSQLSLQGVQQLLVVRSQLILPILLPKLTILPMTEFNARALSSIADVAGGALSPHLSTLIPILMRLNYVEAQGSANVQASSESLTKALHSVLLSAESSGINTLISELGGFCSDSLPSLREAALQMLGLYARVKGKTMPKGWLDQIANYIAVVLKLYHDRDVRVVKTAISSLSDVLATVDPETVATSSVNYIQVINDAIESLHVPDTLEGFCMEGGIAPLLPIFVAAMRNGNAELREQVSLGIRNIVVKTDKASLTPAVLQSIAGPLIRILSEPNLESRIRADILMTLNLLVERGGENLKQFATTLQVTYMKAISATYKPTREQAAIGTSKLLGLGAKPDFLIRAILPALKASATTNPDACLSAISKVYQGLTSDPLEATSQGIREALIGFMSGGSTSEHVIRSKASEAMAFTFRFTNPEAAVQKLTALGLVQGKNEDLEEAGFLTLYHLFILSSTFGAYAVESADLVESIKSGLETGSTAFIRGAAGQALGALLTHVSESKAAAEYSRALAKSLDDDDSIDVKICVLNSIRLFAKTTPDKAELLLPILVPAVLQRVKKSMLSLKYAAERALYYLLQIRNGPDMYQQFASSLPDAHVKTFLEFCKVVLGKLPEHSDDEDAYDDSYNE